MKAYFLLIIAIFFLEFIGFSQDTIVFISGKIISGEIMATNNSGVAIKTKGFLFKNSRQFYNDEIFSTSVNNQKVILYRSDSSNGNDFNEIQMSYYIKGIQEGKKYYHAPFATIGGFTCGVTGGVLGFWGMTIPTAYVLIAGIKTPKVNVTLEKNENIIPISENNLPRYGLKYNGATTFDYNEKLSYYSYYSSGYQAAAKDKKIKNAIKGGVIGFLAFLAGSYVLISR